MTAVIVNQESLAVFRLIDNTSLRSGRATVEVRYAALFAEANIFVILFVASIVRFVRPGSTVLEVEVRRATVVDNTVQMRVSSCKCERYAGIEWIIFFHNENIAVNVDIAIADCITNLTEVHRYIATIGSECIIAVLRAFWYGDLTTACDGDFAIISNRCDTVTVYIKVNITNNKNAGVVYLRYNTCIVEAGEYIILADTDTPVLVCLTFDGDITIDFDLGFADCFRTLFAPAVSLSDCDTVTTHTAFHTDIDITLKTHERLIQSNLRCRRINPDSVGQ